MDMFFEVANTILSLLTKFSSQLCRSVLAHNPVGVAQTSQTSAS